jgi:uncharacterized membrane protein
LWLLAIPIVAIAALMAPMALTGRTFGIDWSGHLWLVEMQQRNIEALGHPSLFVQSGLGAFYAWYAFYGGTLYGLAGGLAALSGGHTTVAYIVFYGLAFVMSYGGCWWVGRQAGLSGWSTHAAPLLFVTSAYFLTDSYARGAWPETMAVSSIPLVVGAAGALLEGERLRRWPALVLLVAGTVLTGSHNITLLLSTIFFALLLAIAVVAGASLRALPWRRVLVIAGLLAVAVAINLWFLLPDIAFGTRTYIGANPTPPYMPRLTLDLLLDPLRDSLLGSSPNLGPTPTFDTQLPTLALLWSLVALAISWRAVGSTARRMAVGIAVLLVALIVLIVSPGIWPHLPRLLWNVQFPYRLLSYAIFCVLALTIIALRHLHQGRSRRVALGVLLAIVAIECGQAMRQIWATPSAVTSRAQIYTLGPSWWTRFVTPGEGVFGDEFSDYSEREVNPSRGGATIEVPARGPVKHGYAVSFTSPGPGTIATNIQTGSYMLKLGGATPAGRVLDGSLVVRLDVPAGKPARVTFQPGSSWPLRVGRDVSLAGCVAALALLLWVLLGALRWLGAMLRIRRSTRRTASSQA